MKVAVTLKKRADGEPAKEARTQETGLRDVTQKLLAALIDNEINSAFIFVAVAKTAYRAAQFSDGNSALSKAEAIYAQASELARDSCGNEQPAIADRLRELRQAVDALRS